MVMRGCLLVDDGYERITCNNCEQWYTFTKTREQEEERGEGGRRERRHIYPTAAVDRADAAS